MAFENQNWALAERCFRAAREGEPDDPKTHYLLARTFVKLGKTAAARACLTEALRLRPEQREFLALRDSLDQGTDLSAP